MSFATFAASVRRARGDSGSALVLVAALPSTNDLGKRLAREYQRDNRDVPPVDVLAWRQTAGRGRGANRWSSPGGAGVWASMVRGLDAAAAVQMLPLAAGVGLARAVEPWLGASCGIKWPNDLTFGGRKLAGVLVEAVMIGERASAVLGFGLNHTAALDRLAAPNPTSIAAECPAPPSLAAVAVACLEAIDAALEQTPAVLVAAFRRRLVHAPGDPLRCRTAAGIIEGRFAGVDERGLLRLETAEGPRTIAAAELLEGETTAEDGDEVDR